MKKRSARGSLVAIIDVLISIIIIPAAMLMLVYRRLGSKRLSLTTARLKRIGVFPIRNHYYEPLFDDRLLSAPLESPRKLPGIDLNESGQLDLLARLGYADEIRELRLTDSQADDSAFFLWNGAFESGDAEFLYQFLRHTKPRKVIEIGSGYSTKLARLALQKNAADGCAISEQICIEPYEQRWLEKLDGVTVVRKRLEQCEIDWTTELAAGDLLFIDSSHIIRPQGDVLKEYLEIFPQLPAGVFIHVHDIFTPRDYPRTWIAEDVLFWNEQYLLEALLSGSRRYEVVAALNYLKHTHFEQLAGVCPHLTPDREPGSFYIRVSA